jgi:subfamily B ATP-binding cassette protein MsbA
VWLLLTATLLAAVVSGLQGVSARLFADIADALNLLASRPAGGRFPTTVRLLHVAGLSDGVAVRLAGWESAAHLLAAALAAVAGVLLLRASLGYGQTYLVARATYRVMTEARNRLHAKMLSLPMRIVTEQRTGDLISRSLDDVTIFSQSVLALGNAVSAAVTIGALVTFMLLQSAPLTAATVAVLPLVAVVVHQFGTRIRRVSARLQQDVGAVASRLQESIFAIRAIKGFGAEQAERARFENDTRAAYRTAMRRVRVFALQSPVAEFVMATGLLGVFALGFWLVLHGGLTFGRFLGHFLLVAMLADPVKKVGQCYAALQQGLASLARVDDVLRLPGEDMDSGRDLSDVGGAVEFRRVSFTYDADGPDGGRAHPALRDVSFRVKPGQTVALVGRSGAGKTTVLHLLARFYEPSEGTILLDGVPLQDISLRSLRSHMGMVLQESVLFAGAVAENIRFARPTATDEEVVEAARRACADEFISQLPNGYATRIGERGVRLSGGQQQRLAIARAFLKDPRVFLLDEATAALDSESEAAIRKSFQDLLQGRTAFVIAHRLSTILHADVILVLDNGRLVESGSHADLLARNGVYARLYHRQFLHDGPAA